MLESSQLADVTREKNLISISIFCSLAQGGLRMTTSAPMTALTLLLLPLTSAASGPQRSWLERLAPTQSLAQQADYARASALLRQGRSRADCERAASLLEGLLAKGEDGDGRLSLACAKALNAIMRIRTNSNTLHITRLLDTPENKAVWRSLGPRALELATRAKKTRPQDPEALVAYADAYFFANSVKGVLAAAVTGSGLEFKGNSKELIRRCPRADGGVGHCYLGAFFLMAPWPLCNPKRAEEHLSTAHRIVPSRRNSYYMGVLHYRLGRPVEAERYFRQALSAKCASASEADFGGFMLREAKAALDACARPKAY
jgi:hypothetical protein